MKTINTDVSIIGAGPTGLCLAYALAEAGLKVSLIERQPLENLQDPVFDGREIALTHESRRLLQQWGLWAHLPTKEISNLRHARVLDGPLTKGMVIEAGGGGQSQRGWFVPNHLIRWAGYQQIAEHNNITLFTAITTKEVSTSAQQATVALEDGTHINSQLLVAADSRFSATRRALGIPSPMIDYGKSMMVFRAEHTVAHEHIAWEWFGYGQTRALLPLNGNRSSVVLTLPQHEMEQLNALDDEAFDKNISQRYEYRLGEMRRISKRNVYPLVGTYATRFHAQRFALIGDAAVGMHPVTAHGFNLGILSVKHLANRITTALRTGQDIAGQSVLRGYTRDHRLSSLPLFPATNFIVSLYTTDRARLPRQDLLKAANAITPFKKLVATRLTG